VERLKENADAAHITLKKDVLDEVRKIVESSEVHGERYILSIAFTNTRYPARMVGNLYADTPPLK
jgi:hypothetical protein